MTEIKSNADIEPCLSVVMPVFNEAATVGEVIKTVLAQRPVHQLVIVDDCSKDGTWEKLQPLAQNESQSDCALGACRPSKDRNHVHAACARGLCS